ncbi:MAG: carbamoyltransferase HypF [Melioribacteraceae bacterium]
MNSDDIKRLQINVNGIVQGVGFRPFVLRLATENNLSGFVRNSQAGVEIEVEGNSKDINRFVTELREKAPPLSEITNLETFFVPVQRSNQFEIIASTEEIGNQTLISPDVCICDDCLSELFDPRNRRYLYPFINCTNCGPRLTIIENIPYDRKYTTMNKFEMCEECSKEYHDPHDRRFHAQPNACPKCGPNIWLEQAGDDVILEKDKAITKAARDLANGKIVAVKGLGGFHLAVDAYNDEAIKKLRERKRREEKPFAVMVPNINSLDDLVWLSDDEKILLSSFARPILLLKKKNCIISESVAPNNKRLGVVIAYTPLHHILLKEFEKISINHPSVLVMTSANFSEEPIEITNDSAKNNLSEVADSFLFHNRNILIRADDSVGMFINNKQRMIRRSRGFVPKPFFIKKSGIAVLGVGAELKNTICLLKNDKAFLSQYIGDLTNFSAHQFFKETINYQQKIIDCKAEYVGYDLHPDYLSTRWAKEESGLPSFGVQHHHAHMASCMGEHDFKKDVIGIILDGTGFGIDNTIWGGEVLIGNYTKVKRFAHLETIPLPGGDAAIKEPWRIAVSYLYHAFDGKLPPMDFLEKRNTDIVLQMLAKKINSPLTSSAGRLFDAVSVICGGPETIRYEAQAAIELMQKINTIDVEAYLINEEEIKLKSISLKTLIRNVVEDVEKNVPSSIISARFHKTLAHLLINKTEQARAETNINDVVLSGGVFQNEILLELMENELAQLNFNIYSHSKIPTNDGGISFGQVMVVNELIAKGMRQVEFVL